MDSPLLNQLFRQLFSHRASRCLARRPQFDGLSANPLRSHRRSFFWGAKGNSKQEKWQQRTDVFPEDMTEEFKRYPLVNSNMLRNRRERPKRVKMLLRDFIEDSLYNPHYGYFSKQVVIFSPGEPFKFNALANERQFHDLLGQRYTAFEDKLDEKDPNDLRQLWHTPTELFRPFYGEAIARYLVTNYKLTSYPYHDLNIYEMGAGNGTMMLNILDYIRDVHPEVYERTKFKVIEISSNLASIQAQGLRPTVAARGHADRVEIINRSIFDWDTLVTSPCFFLALEVFDNFAHDALRYDQVTQEPLQSQVLIDPKGEFYEFYSREIDPVAARYLRVRHAACGTYPHPLGGSRIKQLARSLAPLPSKLTMPEYIPTRLMQFFDILYNYFPAHKLITSDFHSLPDTVMGINAPVVQTRYRRQMVPVSTPLVQQGYFDILFPTDFAVMESIYQAITGKLTRRQTHEDFMKAWAYVEDTQTRNGENPLLTWYKNASVMTSYSVT